MGFAGVWDVVIATPIGDQHVKLKIEENNGALAGNASLGSETVPFIDPALNGDHLTWSQTITKPMKMTVKFALQRVGDTLTGTAKPGIFPSAKVTGARSKTGE